MQNGLVLTSQTRGLLAEGKPFAEAVREASIGRVRPKIMTVAAIMAGLLPILSGNGAGASVMKRIAAPMIGGMISSTVLTLVVIPAVYALVRERELSRIVAEDTQLVDKPLAGEAI